MSDAKNPVPGDLHIDATEINVVDLIPEYLNTLTKLRSGHQKAVANIARLTPEQLKAAGINPDEAAEIVAIADEHKKIRIFYEATVKMAELLWETQVQRGHDIAIRMAEIVEQARRRADKSPNRGEILGPLDDLLDYQLGPAQRGAATKKRAALRKSGEAQKPAGEPAP